MRGAVGLKIKRGSYTVLGRTRNNIFFGAGVEIVVAGRGGAGQDKGLGWWRLGKFDVLRVSRGGRARIAVMRVFCCGEFFSVVGAASILRRVLSGGGQGSAQFGNGAFGALCYIPKPSFFARASARSRTAFSARSISAFRAAMFSFAIFERSASVYKNAPSKLPHVGSIL